MGRDLFQVRQMSTDFPKRLPEKLRAIRERSRLTPAEFAPHVHALNGAAIIGYENGTDMPARVLNAYVKLSGVPLQNLLDDDRDLWFGHVN